MNCVSHYTRTSAFINEKQNKTKELVVVVEILLNY